MAAAALPAAARAVAAPAAPLRPQVASRGPSSTASRPFGRPAPRCARRCSPVVRCASLQAAHGVLQLLPPEFGYVALTAVASTALIGWQTIEVAKQRRKAGVPYPKMFEDKDDSVFNCYQRAHQNTMESYPAFIAMLLLSGLAYPVTAAVFGTVWIIGRLVYSMGYYSGDPQKRHQGAWHGFGLMGLIGTACVFAFRQLGVA
eukprot:SM000171S03230  [mRNA]  locus=s171:103368:104883:+ [translate_table: standard]